jgi:serine/threonine-protein kinase HipA
MRLAVELYGTTVAVLTGRAHEFDVAAATEGIARFGTNATVLSVAIPLTPVMPRHLVGRRRAWFTELLPEGPQYELMLAQARLRDGDMTSFLARYGRDTAGALQIWDLDDPTEPRTPSIHPVSDDEVRTLLLNPDSQPLGNDPAEGRSSLGGVQPKVVLVRTDDGWAQGLGGHPTSHILKPSRPGSTLVHDEEYGARLARRIGLATHQTWVETIAGIDALVVERYDRDGGRRVHQEDFSQVLGARGNQKYQEHGDVVSLRKIASVLRTHTPTADLHALARLVVFTVAIGNLDLHTKNVSLLHPVDDDPHLAPVYDPVPLVTGSDGRLALAVDDRYAFAEITRARLAAEISGWGLRQADTVVAQTLDELAAAVASEVPLPGARPDLDTQIARFTARLLANKTPR